MLPCDDSFIREAWYSIDPCLTLPGVNPASWRCSISLSYKSPNQSEHLLNWTYSNHFMAQQLIFILFSSCEVSLEILMPVIGCQTAHFLSSNFLSIQHLSVFSLLFLHLNHESESSGGRLYRLSLSAAGGRESNGTTYCMRFLRLNQTNMIFAARLQSQLRYLVSAWWSCNKLPGNSSSATTLSSSQSRLKPKICCFYYVLFYHRLFLFPLFKTLPIALKCSV